MHVVTEPVGSQGAAVDICQPFVLANGAFRGRFVRLTQSVTTILERHADPSAVSELLCEAMTAAVALAGTMVSLRFKRRARVRFILSLPM